MNDPIVEIKNGLIRGLKKRSIENYDFCAFLGIPYAVPPVGELRFKDPVPFTKKWTDIREATKYGSMCTQYDIFTRDIGGSEDCLYINVFVRSVEEKDKLKPVMFWIHGGAWLFGSGDDNHFGPDYLLRKDIVLITFNYRLGIFGFLNLEDEIAPGNQGLKDQITALRWVHENIRNFGGDPENITIFGESAGSISVHFLAISPLSKGLFHKAISQSGTIFNPWSYTKHPKINICKMCSSLGKYLSKSEDIVNFLKNLDHRRLAQAQEQVRRTMVTTHGICMLSPGVDSKSPNPALPIPFDEAVQQGIQVPWLIGHNNREGVGFLIDIKKDEYIRMERNPHKIINERSADLLEEYDLTISDLKKLYFGKEKITVENCNKLADMLGSLYINDGIQRAIRLQIEKSKLPTYYYEFSYSSHSSLTKSILSYQVEGACHFDEVEYLFFVKFRLQMGFEIFKKGTQEYRLMERITEMWTNFATYGKPTLAVTELIPVEWEPVKDPDNLRCLNIGNTMKMETALNVHKLYLSIKTGNEH